MKIRLLCLFMFACLLAWGQGSTAQINGTIQDSSGAAVPGAEVKATQTATGATRSVTSGADGAYVLANLPVGPYQIEVSKDGFSRQLQSGISLLVDSSPTIDIALKIGSVAEQVVVQADAALVETRNSGIGQVVENQRIMELPLNGRVVTDLITLSGAAVQTGTSRDNTFAGAIIAVGGGLSFGTAYNLDGAKHLNFITAAPMPLPFPDALQEFKIETSGLAAQHSQETEVSGVTKSGSNTLHGDLFEFLRNDAFNANPYNVVGTTKSTLKRNQFGGTIGGAIKKDKLFFFGGFQGTTLRQDVATAQAFLPTAAMLAGDWTAVASRACNQGRQINLGAPFVNGGVDAAGNTIYTIDPANFSRTARNIVTKLNQLGTGNCGLALRGTPVSRNEYQYVARVDYQVSEKHAVFGRYLATPVKVKIPFSLTPTNFLNTASGTGYDNLAQSFAIGDTYLVSPSIVNSLRLGFQRAFIGVLGPAAFSLCDVGSNIYCGYSGPMFAANITGGFTMGTRFTTNNDFWSMTSYQIGDDVSVVRGSHQFSFGGNLGLGKNQEIYNYYAIPSLTFSATTGLGLGDFLLGKVQSFTQGAVTDHTLRQTSVSLYATDTWRATSRLTVNYGLRWEPYLPQVMFHNRVLNFDTSRFLQGVHSTVYPNAPAGVYYVGDKGFPGQSGVNNQWAHFAPRVGLAWDVRGDGRTSVRASFGFGYNYVSGLWREDYSAGSPWTNYTTLLGVSLDNPYQSVLGGNPFPLDPTRPRFSQYTNFQSMDYDAKTPSTSSWNLSIQRQIGSDWIVSGTYIGNETSHVWAQKPGNPAVYQGPNSTVANTNQRRTLSLLSPQEGQYIGYLGLLDPNANVSYEAMLLSLQHRFSRHFTLQTNYTWSHCIASTYADLTSGGPDATETYSNPANRDADRGPCYADRRHVFNLTGVVQSPHYSGRVLGLLANDWSLSGIYRRQSGQPLDVFTQTDVARTGITLQRPNQVLPDVYGSDGPGGHYLNPAAFALPAVGTTGNVGFNSVVGPKFWSFDVSLARTIKITEGQRLELRGEAYNLTNSFRPTLVLTNTGGSAQGQTIDASTFGQIRTSLDPRILQFAMKYVF